MMKKNEKKDDHPAMLTELLDIIRGGEKYELVNKNDQNDVKSINDIVGSDQIPKGYELRVIDRKNKVFNKLFGKSRLRQEDFNDLRELIDFIQENVSYKNKKEFNNTVLGGEKVSSKH